MFNKTGKTLTIFISLIIILLISSTSIGFFLYNKEEQQRKIAERDRDISRDSETKLQVELKDVKKQMVLLQDKNKEADTKINNLLDEIDLNEGLRKELKKENASLKEQSDGFAKIRTQMQADMDELSAKVKEYQAMLKAEQDKERDLQGQLSDLQETKRAMETKITEMKSDMNPYAKRSPEEQVSREVIEPKASKDKVELDKIVVSPQDGVKGHILSVDKETEFVICNLGLKQGIKSADVLSVYRGEEYLGDVKVTRVQEEMAAADIIPPFSSRKVRKNDSVIVKP